MANGDDVSDWDGAGRLVQTALDSYGELHALVNNAGILRDRMFVNMDVDMWDAVIKVHLRGTFAPTKHAVAHWRARHKADNPVDNPRIVNTTSPSGLYGNVGQANYGAAKAAIAAFTVILADELGRLGITVNAIAPSAHRPTSHHWWSGWPPLRRQRSPARCSTSRAARSRLPRHGRPAPEYPVNPAGKQVNWVRSSPVCLPRPGRIQTVLAAPVPEFRHRRSATAHAFDLLGPNQSLLAEDVRALGVGPRLRGPVRWSPTGSVRSLGGHVDAAVHRIRIAHPIGMI